METGEWIQDNRSPGGHQRQCALNREERTLDVDVELLVEVALANLFPNGTNSPMPAFAKTISSLPFCSRMV